MKRLNRRRFLQGSMLAGAALSLPGRGVLGANSDVRLGIIGLGGQGRGHIGRFASQEEVRIVALADPDRERLETARERAPGAEVYTDLRRILERTDVDAVCVACPVHWHALAGIWALEAGKDLYLEKPFSHNVWESRQVVKAVRKHGRIVQIGTQQRSDPLQAELKEYLHSGALGRILFARAMRFGPRGSIGKRSEPLVPPSHVDYDVWLGPAQDLPMHRDELQYDWHWDWNTGAGEAGNWGAHVVDDLVNVALLDDRTPPTRFIAAGGRVGWNDGGNTPNAHITYFETEKFPFIFEVRNMQRGPEDQYRGTNTGYVVEFENGYYSGGRGGGAAYDKRGNVIRKFEGDRGEGHVRNFLDAVRSRRAQDLAAGAETIHQSNVVCHLANLAYRLAERPYHPEKVKELVGGFKPWQETIERFNAHLEFNQVRPDDPALKMGATMLEFDPEKETLTGPTATPEALRLLSRNYREPFVVREQ